MSALLGPTVTQAMQAPRNNFTLLRLLLALAVVLSHAFSVVTGEVKDEPLVRATGYTLGEHAVNGFFAISGFLVTMSFDRRGWRDYAIARTLRIAPALIVATLVVALLVGGAMTSLAFANYVASPGLWRFIAGTLTTFKSSTAAARRVRGQPAALSDGDGLDAQIRGPVLCRRFCNRDRRTSRLAPARRRRRRRALRRPFRPRMPPASIRRASRPSLRLPLIFACGGALYRFARAPAALGRRHRGSFARDRGVLGARRSTSRCCSSPPPMAILWLALSPALARVGVEPPADLSYGTYLYGWPVQQTLHALFPALAPLALSRRALVVTLAVAALSWYAVEKPALTLKSRVVGRGSPVVSAVDLDLRPHEPATRHSPLPLRRRRAQLPEPSRVPCGRSAGAG